MIRPTPSRHTTAPATSHRSGRNPSATIPHSSEPGGEYPTVGGQYPTEVRVGLERGDEAVRPEREHPGARPHPATMFADALPHQPSAADLEQRGEHEQGNRL